MDNETPDELLRLLNACNDTTDDAMRLAQRTDAGALKSFLQESARQYRHAADELLSLLRDSAAATPELRRRAQRASEDSGTPQNVAELWERAECEALTCFRDAYDTSLPSPLADTVKRHYEAGVTRLERFRKLQSYT